MKFYRHIERCNQIAKGGFIRWEYNNKTLGWLREENIRFLKKFSNIFIINDAVRLKKEESDFKEISLSLEKPPIKTATLCSLLIATSFYFIFY